MNPLSTSLWRRWLKSLPLVPAGPARSKSEGRPSRRLALESLEERSTPAVLNFAYADQFGGSGADLQVRDVATDAFGNTYLIGRFSGTVDFDPGSGTHNLTANKYDAFVVKLDSAGGFVYADKLGGGGYEDGLDIAVDGAGNAYITGDFEGTADFGGTSLTSAGQDDAFVVKLDGSGNVAYARQFGGTGYDHGHGIAVDGAGNAYVIGYFEGTADFGPGSGTTSLTSAGSSDVFVVKLDSTGNLTYSGQIGGADFDVGTGIATDGAGNVYVTGYFSGTADLDPGSGTYNLTSAGSFDAFVAKLDSTGTLAYAGQIGGAGDDLGTGIVTDGAGNAYVTGSFSGTADLDPGSGTYNLTSAGSFDVFVVKLDSTGKLTYAGQIGGAGEDFGYATAVDGAGNAYLTGYFSGTADLDPGSGTTSLTSAGGYDAFVVKLDSASNLAYAGQIGGPENDAGIGIAVDGAGNASVVGAFSGTADFDPGSGTYNLTSVGRHDDGFVVKLTPPAPAPAPVTPVAAPTLSSAIAGPGGMVVAFNSDGSMRFIRNGGYAGYTGTVSIALGDLNGDGVLDVITGTTSGIGLLRAFDGATGADMGSMTPFGNFPGGINVAAGDINGDGRADILIGTASGASMFMAISGRDGSILRAGEAFPGYTGGVTVALGDLNGDQKADLILGSASGVGFVTAYSGADGSPLAYFLASPMTGVNVAAGDLDGDGKAEIVAGTRAGLAGVAVFTPDGTALARFMPFGMYTGGAFVAVTDHNADGDREITVGGGLGGMPMLAVYSYPELAPMAGMLPFGLDYLGGISVA